MWSPDKIIISNLFAHVHSEYVFKNNRCTVIFGKNKTDRGMDNNGAGKSTLFEGISLALTNDTLREVKKEAFINRDAEECYIDFSLKNLVLKKELRIVRTFFRGNKPTKIQLYENKELNKQITSVSEANKRVFELVGVNREDLLRYFIIGQGSHYTFFTASDSEKKEIMNRITSADLLNPALEELSLRAKRLEAEYNEIVGVVEGLTVKKDILEEQRQEVLDNDNTESEVEKLSEKINETKKLIQEGEVAEKKYKSAVKVREEQISALDVKDVSDLRKKRKSLREELEELEEELRETSSIRNKCQVVLYEVVICPNCREEIGTENELELQPNEARELIEEADKIIPKLELKVKAKSKEIERLNKEIKEAERVLELVDGLEEEKSQYERKLKRKLEELNDYREDINSWEEKKKELKKTKKNDKILVSINEKLAQVEKELLDNVNKSLELGDQINMVKFWQFNMGRSGFMTYLANKSVKIIEGITNSFLKKFDVDLTVLLNGFTVLKSGEVREKIDVFVQTDGTDAEPFKAKSGGEQGRVTLAGILGIQHLINLSTDGMGLNLLCFDECFNGVDSLGQENIIKIFEKLGITILMITQNVSDNFNSENKLYVVKEDKVAKYIENLQS